MTEVPGADDRPGTALDRGRHRLGGVRVDDPDPCHDTDSATNASRRCRQVVEDERHAAADEPAVLRCGVHTRPPNRPADRDHGQHRADDGGEYRDSVEALGVPVLSALVHGEQVVHDHLLLTHQVVVGDQDAEQRADERAEGFQRVVDDLRVVVEVPRCDQHRTDGRDHAACAPADPLRADVGEVERRTDEVGDDVDADGGDREGQGTQHDGEGAVDAGHRLDRVGDQFAEHRQGQRRGHDDEYREHQEVDRQTEEVATS